MRSLTCLSSCVSDLRNGSAVFWGGGVSGGIDALLLDEDRGWLMVGGKDHIYLLKPDSLEEPAAAVRVQTESRRSEGPRGHC